MSQIRLTVWDYAEQKAFITWNKNEVDFKEQYKEKPRYRTIQKLHKVEKKKLERFIR